MKFFRDSVNYFEYFYLELKLEAQILSVGNGVNLETFGIEEKYKLSAPIFDKEKKYLSVVEHL